MSYQIIYATNKEIYIAALSLEKKVNDYIEKGWIPQGGVSVSRTSKSYCCTYTVAQAMIYPK